MKKIIKSNNPFVKIMFGTISGIITAAVFMLIFAFLIVKYDFSYDIYKYFWFVITAFASFVSSIACALYLKNKRLLFSMISGTLISIIIFLLLLLVSAFNVNYLLFIIPLVGMVFSFIGTLFAASKY